MFEQFADDALEPCRLVPDDAELGMGGTIVRLMAQGWKVGILDLTSGEPTPLGSPEAWLRVFFHAQN